MLVSRVSSYFPVVYRLSLIAASTIQVTFTSAKGAFSKQKLLRSVISKEKLDNLVVLENTEAKTINKLNLAQNFACLNAQNREGTGI